MIKIKRLIKQDSNNPKKKGVTYVELLVASAITFLVLGVIFVLWNFAEKAWYAERTKAKVLAELQITMEKLKREMMVSDGYKIFYYRPAGAAVDSAVSFPLAVDNEPAGAPDGFIEVDPDTLKIIWDKTVIYHVYDNTVSGKKELRRTVFEPRDNDLTPAQRQTQLDDVVESTTGEPPSSYLNWDEDETRTLCENDNVVLTFEPMACEFDGYSSEVGRSEKVTFGSVPLTAGDHYITFEVIGQNASSTGHRLGIDSFSISPSGCDREGEEATVLADSGDTKVNEDMLAYGSWSGNRHLEYRANNVGDYIDLSFYYDRWVETNFVTCSPSNALIEYSNRTGDEGETSGNNDNVMWLHGFGDSWSAEEQTGVLRTPENLSDPNLPFDGIIVRNVILSKNIEIEGRAIKITFDNISTGNITIDEANIMEQLDGPSGVAGTYKQITIPDGGLIEAGTSKESDWIDINDFDREKDYLITFHIPTGSYTMSGWAGEASDVHSYVLEGPLSVAQQEDWTGQTPIETGIIYTIDSIDVSYFSGDVNGGTPAIVTSPVYDTGLDNPNYNTLAWNIAKNNYGGYETGDSPGANLILRVRANDSESALKASTDWSGAIVVDTKSASGSTTATGSIDNDRYVQFHAEFKSQPTAGKADYVKSCVLKNLSIKWLGETTSGGTTMVDANGYFTTRPDYGIFAIEVDGQLLTKGMRTTVEISESVLETTVACSSTVEVESRNTGK